MQQRYFTMWILFYLAEEVSVLFVTLRVLTALPINISFSEESNNNRVSCDELLLRRLVDVVLWMSAAAAVSLGRSALRRRCRESGGLANAVVDLTPFELHLPGHNFAGPGTDLSRRLRINKRRAGRRRPKRLPRRPSPPLWRKNSAPINAVDLAAYFHDLAYLAAGKGPRAAADRALADRDLLDEAEELMVGREGGGGLGERISAAVVWAVMNAKGAFA